MDPTPPKDQVLTGRDFLLSVRIQEDACEALSLERLPQMGDMAPKCVERLGSVLSLLDRMASCWWKCARKDHVVEYLCGRAASHSRAALRLALLGFYDEALVLCRGVGELANLLGWFSQDSAILDDWKNCSRRERLQKYSPFQVRLALEAAGLRLPIGKERYTLLSERAAHATPDTRPQAHNPSRRPSSGGTFQEVGLLVAVNELAVSVSLATIYSALLLELEKRVKLEIVEAATSLAEAIGRATITEIDEYYATVLRELRGQVFEGKE